MGRPIAMHLSFKSLLRTPEAHHEAYQSMISAVSQTAENNLSGPPVEIHHPCPNYQRWLFKKENHRNLDKRNATKITTEKISSCI
ncbi:hypothetical protein J6590_009332 [Homalodisca vitripennis]|nr:hypothetical protein J6590_009332 [Homalodisca vitripennis]